MIWGPMVTKEHHFPSIGEDEDVTPPPPAAAPQHMEPSDMEMHTAFHQLDDTGRPAELPAYPLGSHPNGHARAMQQEDYTSTRNRYI